jgi:hypothetical protein
MSHVLFICVQVTDLPKLLECVQQELPAATMKTAGLSRAVEPFRVAAVNSVMVAVLDGAISRRKSAQEQGMWGELSKLTTNHCCLFSLLYVRTA